MAAAGSLPVTRVQGVEGAIRFGVRRSESGARIDVHAWVKHAGGPHASIDVAERFAALAGAPRP